MTCGQLQSRGCKPWRWTFFVKKLVFCFWSLGSRSAGLRWMCLRGRPGWEVRAPCWVGNYPGRSVAGAGGWSDNGDSHPAPRRFHCSFCLATETKYYTVNQEGELWSSSGQINAESSLLTFRMHNSTKSLLDQRWPSVQDLDLKTASPGICCRYRMCAFVGRTRFIHLQRSTQILLQKVKYAKGTYHLNTWYSV